MKHIFQAQEGSILIADPSNQIRMGILSAFKSANIKHVESCESVAEIRYNIRSKKISWVVTSLFATATETAFEILQLICNTPEFRSVRVTFLLNEEEYSCIPLAFENGLMSWQAKLINTNSLQSALKELLEVGRNNGFDSTIVAAHYLRKYLRSVGDGSSLLNLEEPLTSRTQKNPQHLLNLAEAQFMADKVVDGTTSLYQAKVLDASLEDKIKALKEKYGDKLAASKEKYQEDKESKPSDPNKEGAFGLKTCLLIDHDDIVYSAIREIFHELGVENIVHFNDGEAAAAWLCSNPEPSLVLQEWRIPKISGPAMIQRIRGLGMRKVPIIVLSSLVRRQDTHLLTEMSVSNVISKPFDKKSFILSLSWTMQQNKFPSEQVAYERKILEYLSDGNIDAALEIKTYCFADPNITESRKKYIEAEFLYHSGCFLEAQNTVISAMKLAGADTLLTTNLLGKCLLKLGNIGAAIKFLEKAQSISPSNLNRLCQISEAQADSGDLEKANKLVEEAKKIDPNNKTVQETETKIAILQHQTDKASQLMAQMQSIIPIISHMNNRAVGEIKRGNFEGGITLYKKTLESIPSKKKDMLSLVNYNMGLAFAKNQELSEASRYLSAALTHAKETDRMHKKSTSLLARVQKSQGEGTPLQISREQNDVEEGTAADQNQIYEAITEKLESSEYKGICLHQIFKYPHEHDRFSQAVRSKKG